MASAEEAIKLEGARITTFSPRAAALERDGSVKDPARLAIGFEVEVDTIAPHMNRITRIYRKRRTIILGFSGVKLQDGELHTFAPKAGRVSNEGDEVGAPMMAFTFLMDLEHAEGRLGKISELYRTRKEAELSIDAIEQLELKEAKKPSEDQLELAASNGHDSSKDKDVAAGRTKKVETGKKDAKKKRVHQPV